jgi:hypothetical protein
LKYIAMAPVEEAEQVVKKRKASDGTWQADPDAFAALAPIPAVSKKGRVRTSSEGKSSHVRLASIFFSLVHFL